MRLKQMTIWSIKECMKSYGIFAGAYALVLLLLSFIVGFISAQEDGSSSGTFSYGSSTIFLFIMGIIIFSQYLRVALANGVSRKTTFGALTLCVVTLSAAAALGESLLIMLVNLQLKVPKELQGAFFSDMPFYLHFLMMFCTGLAVAFVGLFIGGAYYRMNKITKILVSIMIPAVLVFGLPTVFMVLPESATASIVSNVLMPVFRFFTGSIWSCMGGSLIIAGIFLVFVFLLIRRAPIKTASSGALTM